MKLNQIVEGVSYKPKGNMSWSDLIAKFQAEEDAKAKDKDKESSKVKKITSRFILNNGTFVYRDQDSPDDLIKIEPFKSSKSLGQIAPKIESLSTFTGGIYYAFSINRDDVELESKPVSVNQPAVDAVEALGGLSTRSQLKREAKELFGVINNKNMIIDAESRQEAIDEYEVIQRALKLMDEMGVDDLNSVTKTTQDEKSNITYRKDVILASVKSTLGKVLKDPRTNKQKVVQRKILTLAARKFADTIGEEYDYVLYPESRSNMNETFARLVATYFGAEVREIKKVDIDADVTINRHELGLHADRLAQKVANGEYSDELLKKMTITPKAQRLYLGGVTHPKGIHPTSELWRDMWEEKEYNKMYQRRSRNAAGSHLNSKRRYYQRFVSPSQDGDLEGFNVLLVDDDVVHSGTMESLHAMLLNDQPAKIDMLVPYYIA